jgi:cysteine-rich repeat protein
MSTDVCDLVLETCDLLDRAPRTSADELLDAAEHLRADLLAAIGACDDEAVAADGCSAVCDLEALIGRLTASGDTGVPRAA